MTNFHPRRIYTILLWLLLPYIFFHLLWRARKQPEYLKHIAERFGFYALRSNNSSSSLRVIQACPELCRRGGDKRAAKTVQQVRLGASAEANTVALIKWNWNKPIIWLHTVSVGETHAAASLVKRLQENYPHHQLLLTHTTPTGRAASEQLYGDDVLRVYVPYDYPIAVSRFLRHFRPSIGILLETEIWFNLIHICHTEKIPLLLLNARLSEKSAARYARYPNLSRSGLRELSLIAAQSTADGARLTALGATAVAVMGNLKFDIEPPAVMLKLGEELRAQFGRERRVFLAASTRAGEEELLLAMLKQTNIPQLLTVIVPRHPQRFDEVAALLIRHGIRFQRRSDHQKISPDTQVVLGNSMGEMFAYYAACDLAFIGGSLLPFGGQNLIEACATGKPVLIGPHTYNFAQASERAVESGAAIRVQDAADLARHLQNFLDHPVQLAEAGQAGLRFVSAHRGATEKALRHISQFID